MEASFLTRNIYKQNIPKALVDRILSNKHLIKSWTDSEGNLHDSRQQLITIRNRIDGDFLKVTYKYGKNRGAFGRVYPKDGCGLGALSRSIRGTLTAGRYIDIDIENCHPNLILHFLKENNFQSATYTAYCGNRNKHINRIKKTFGCSRHEAKIFFIIAGYNGSFNKWLNTLEDTTPGLGKKERKKCEALFHSMQAEALCLATKFTDTQPKRFKSWKSERSGKKYNAKFGYLSAVIQNYEREVLETMVLHLRDKGLIIDNEVILCHDGLMILDTNKLPKDWSELEADIEAKCSFKLKVVTKPLENFIDKLEEPKLIPKGSPFSRKYFGDLYCYAEKKEYFERFVCKIINTSSFMLLDIANIDGVMTYSHIPLTRANLRTSYECFPAHTLFGPDDIKNKKDGPKKFIDKWIADDSMRTYDRIDWIPYNGSYKQEDPHTFNLFTGYSPLIHSPLPDDPMKCIAPALDILLNLCENKKECLDFLIHFVADAVQFPNKKMRMAIIFTGDEGTGKDTLLTIMGYIFGALHVKSDSNIENFTGTHAMGFVKKIMICFNESASANTHGNQGVIKTLISEDTTTVNEKYMPIVTCKNTARVFAASNKADVMAFDAVANDRRWIAFKTTSKYSQPEYEEWWAKAHAHFKTPGFIASFYNYLNNIDLSNYNFKTERRGVLTETYREMARHRLPPAAEWVASYVGNYEHVPDAWHEPAVEPVMDCWKSYLNWQKKNRPDAIKDSGYLGSVKSFKASLKSLKIPFIFRRRGHEGKDAFQFIPVDVMTYLLNRKWVPGVYDMDDEEDAVDMVEFVV